MSRRRSQAWRTGALFLAMLAGLAPLARPLHAMPADPTPHVFVQPDGTRITLYLRGDEWLHWQEDDRGHAVVQDGATWRYAKLGSNGGLVATPYAVGTVDPEVIGVRAGVHPVMDATDRAARAAALRPARGAGKASTSPTGTVKNLVVLCLFSDQTVAAYGRAQGAYDSLFNAVNSTGFDAPTGSVRDYYYQASYGTMTLASTVLAWVTLPHPQSYYANNAYGMPAAFKGNPASPYPNNACGMIHDALDILDATVNFADFDTDNDGYVDAIDFIHSGYGGEQNGNGPGTIWSHKGNLSNTNCGGVWTSADQNANHVNVKVDLYHTEPARWDTFPDSRLTRVGVIAHETGHFFGLPDLYDLDGSSQGIGSWCLMSNAWGWDNSQLEPPLFSAWCRVQLGWAIPTVVTGPVGYSLPKVETNPNILQVSTGMPSGEYLLIENREPYGFDGGIPKGGLAVWHIDDNVGNNNNEGYPGQSGWPGNGNHYHVALLQADGHYNLEKPFARTTVPTPPDSGNFGDGDDLFRASGVWHTNEATVPSTNSYVGLMEPTGIDIQTDSNEGDNMNVWVRPGYWVDFTATNPIQVGTFDWPFHTLANAISSTPADGGIVIKAGTTSERPTITKTLRFRSYGGVTTIGP